MSTVVVTGAGRGIGREVARALAAEGHRLGLMARTRAELEETQRLTGEAGADAIAVAGSVTEPDDVERVCAQVEDRFGAVEALVSCAAVYGPCVPFLEQDVDAWWQVLETNLRGPALLLRRLLPAMVEAGGGRVVNLSTRMAFDTTASVPFSAYGVSKGALLRLSALLAEELDGTGVALFDISPGLVRTDMSAQMTGSEAWPEEAWLPASLVAGKVAALLSGAYDGLSGHFLHARDDLDAVLAAVAEDPLRRTTQLTRTGPGDPLGTGTGIALSPARAAG
ncbi:SDR family NAD(P)-dependent oxidoreductase [Nocardioides sp. R1-1]|uniref:SDR family NAD(P)-dependent oxidoreductase n=1 Tax=Nocardioides sp. R1-1 TaxID=3383502 RepID=UPI0038D0EC43